MEASNVPSIQPALPSFYALDLVQFGLKHKSADAVRLGEQLLIQNGEKMPRELAMGVKNYLLDSSNNKAYREAMARSGPITSSSLYHGESAGPIFALDDPHFRESLMKNRKREDQWRNPSALAWDHKKFGLLGEVVDMARHQEEYERYCK